MELSSSRCHALMTRTSSSSWGAQNCWETPRGFIFGARFSNVSYQQRDTKLPSHCARRNWYQNRLCSIEKTWRADGNGPSWSVLMAVTLSSKQTQCIGRYNLERHRESSSFRKAFGRLIHFFTSSTSNTSGKGPTVVILINPSCRKDLSQFVLSEICGFLSCPALDCTN